MSNEKIEKMAVAAKLSGNSEKFKPPINVSAVINGVICRGMAVTAEPNGLIWIQLPDDKLGNTRRNAIRYAQVTELQEQ